MARKLDIDHDPPDFWGVAWDSEYRGFIFSWFAQTPFRNMTWARLIVIRLGWPPVMYFCGLVTEGDPNERRW